MREQNSTPVLPIRNDAKSEVKDTTIDSEDHSKRNAKQIDEQVSPTASVLPASQSVLSPEQKSTADDMLRVHRIPCGAAHFSRDTIVTVITTEGKVLEGNKGPPGRSPELIAKHGGTRPFWCIRESI